MQYNAEWRVLVESCCQQMKTQEVVNILEILDGFLMLLQHCIYFLLDLLYIWRNYASQ